MKKLVYTISLLSISLIGFMYFSKPVKAYISGPGLTYAVIGTYGEFYDIGGTSEYEIHKVNYRTTSILGYDTDNLYELIPFGDVEVVVTFNNPNEILGYNVFIGSNFLEFPSQPIISYIIITHYEFIFYDLQNNIILTHTYDSTNPYNPTEIFYTIQVYDYDGSNHIYNQGYDRGYIDGKQVGYEEGRSDYGEYFPPGSSDGMSGWYSFQDGYDYGYEYGMNDYGYDDNGIIIPGQNAYDLGYSRGTQESGELKANIIDFVPGVLGAIFMFFFQLGQIGILGITILDILGIIVLISGLIFLIKFFF